MIAILLLAAAADTVAPPDDAALYAQLLDRVVATYDEGKGGYVNWKAGIPGESPVELGLKIGNGDAADEWTKRSLVTMEWTWTLFDTMSSGGYVVRASKDMAMEAAHFDKPSDLNARRLENHILAWRLLQDPAERKRAKRVVDYFERVLQDGRGAFVTSQIGDREPQPRANGLAIHAWLNWARATGEPRQRDFSLRSLDRVWEFCKDPELGLLLRRDMFGAVVSAPRLDDQVEMGRAHVLAAHLAGREIDRERATALGDLLLEYFEDPEKHGFRDQVVVQKTGKVKKAGRDFSENARAALFLCELTQLTGDTRYEDAARRAWRAFHEDFEKARFDAADWAMAIRTALQPDPAPTAEWQVAEKQPTAPKKSFRFKIRR